MPKIDALYLYSSYMHIHIWALFNSITGTTLYTNIVEASLFDFIEGVSSPHHFPPLMFLLISLFFSVTVLNVQLHWIFPSLDCIWNIWRTFKFEQSLNSAHTGLKNISFYTRLQAAKAPQKSAGGVNEAICATPKVCTQGETYQK